MSPTLNLENAAPPPYIESLEAFLAEEDPPLDVIFPHLLPKGVLMLLHGQARARKTLTAFELALSAATGTAPFGLARFTPREKFSVLYVQEEDPRSLTRPRLRALVRARCGDAVPATLHVAVRRGVDLDDPAWVTRLIEDIKRLDVKLLVLDAARRLSAKTDEGPAKVRELTAVLRFIINKTSIAIIIVHHDVKPPTTGQDQRGRSHRASGGDWFAACECPVHVERISVRESLVFPEDYKFSTDPDPFTFAIVTRGDGLISQLAGTDITTESAEHAGARGKLLDWLRVHGPASKTAMRRAGLAWETITPVLDSLLRLGVVDEASGRTRNSRVYFVADSTRHPSDDGCDAEPG